MMVQCSAVRPLQRSLLRAPAAGTQGQSILSTVQPQLLPAIDLIIANFITSLTNLNLKTCLRNGAVGFTHFKQDFLTETQI